MDQLQLMHADFGSCLDHLFNEICQMNTKIGRIARWQSRIGNFALSPSPDPTMESFDSGDDAFGSTHNNKMTVSQCFNFFISQQKRGSSFGYERVVLLLGGRLD